MRHSTTDTIIGWLSMVLVAGGAWWAAVHHPTLALAAALWLGTFGFLLAFHRATLDARERRRTTPPPVVNKVGFRDWKGQ